MTAEELARLNRKWNCRLTTIGRSSGRPRTVTLWFVLADNAVYLAGGKQMPQWCRNIRVNAPVTVDIDGTTLHGDAHLIEDAADGAIAIDRFPRKYFLARLSRPFGGYRRSVPVIVRLGRTPPIP